MKQVAKLYKFLVQFVPSTFPLVLTGLHGIVFQNMKPYLGGLNYMASHPRGYYAPLDTY
jgi:hypothetical protein